jgi:hypothetical protein
MYFCTVCRMMNPNANPVDYNKMATDLNDAKPCDYFRNYVMSYSQKANEIRPKLSTMVSMKAQRDYKCIYSHV